MLKCQKGDINIMMCFYLVILHTKQFFISLMLKLPIRYWKKHLDTFGIKNKPGPKHFSFLEGKF